MKKILLILLVICIIYIVIANTDDKKPNVILITLDTVRADHIGFYGYKNIKTPNLDQFAAKSTTFLNAFTPSPLTLPSHSSIFTGLYPQTHNVHDNDIFQLRKSIITLPEFLHKQGYYNVAFVSSIILNSYYGLDQGFDHYDDLSNVATSTYDIFERQAGTTTTLACNWIKKSKTPFFMWVHYFDPHYPYTPPPPFSELYHSKPYDGEIAYTDSSLAKLFDCISNKYDINNFIVIIAGDHGEGLYNHDEEKHGIFLYNSTIKVPLIIKIPHAKPATINDNVCLTDILPTILDYLDIPIPPYIEGKSLINYIFPSTAKSTTSSDRIIFIETFMPFYTYNWAPLFAVIKNNLKYIEAPYPELYDLLKDNNESFNLFNKQTSDAKILKAELDNFFNKPLIKPWDIKNFFSSSKSDPTIKEKLKSLGYASAPSASPPASLPDPKNMIHLLYKLNIAQDYYNKSLYNEAVAILQEILAKDKNNGPALSLISQCLSNMNRNEEALTYILQAIKIYPNNDSLILSAALIYKKIAKYDEAETLLLKLISSNPYNSKAYASLINLYLQQNNISKASNLIAEARKIKLNDPDLFFAQAQFYIKQQKLNEAQILLEKGLAIDGNNANAIANLAKIFFLQNKIDDAISLWEKYLKIVPENAEITAFLGSVYWNNKHNKAKAQELLTKALKLNPNHPQAPQWLSLLSSIKNSK